MTAISRHGPASTAAGASSSMIGRASVILDAFGASDTRLRLERIAARAGLPTSSTHRIVVALVESGWLARDGHAFVLGPLSLRFRSPDRGGCDALRAAAAPYLHLLHRYAGAPVYLSVREGADEIIVDAVGAHRSLAAALPAGARRPAHTTVSGRVLLAGLAPEKVDDLLAASPAGRKVCNAGLHRDLDWIRRYGVAVDRHPRRRAVAAAITSPSTLAGAVSVVIPAHRTSLDWYVPLVASAARHATTVLANGDATDAAAAG